MQLPGSRHRLFIRPFHDHVDDICATRPDEAALAFARLLAASEQWEKSRRRRWKQRRTGYPTPTHKAFIQEYQID